MNAALWDVTIPVDSSASSQRGVTYAIELGRAGATLHFCSVVDVTGACLGAETGTLVDLQPLVQMMNDDAQKRCDEAVALARQSGVVADGKVIFGAVAPAIRRFAQERTSDALVIGTHARTGFERAFNGSTTERLMQTSDVPVIATHEDDIYEDGPIAVAIDETAAATGALRVAIDVARSQRRPLVIINIVEGGRESWLASQPILSDAADIARAAEIDFELVTIEGPTAKSIIEAAKRQHSPMIVIGTRGRSDLTRMLLGSVAATVVELAHVPVAVVRETAGHVH